MHYLKHIKFGAYKSFQSLDVELNKGLNIVIGPNGSGKSNFLEILSQVISLIPEVLIDSLDKLYYELHFADDRDGVQTTIEFRYSKSDINEHSIVNHSYVPNLVQYSLKCHTSGLSLLNIQKSGEVSLDLLSSQLAIDLNEVKILVPKSLDLGFN
ncbi:MAG: AAA family ATPase, partial [Cyclobacteriaceae bacterium]